MTDLIDVAQDIWDIAQGKKWHEPTLRFAARLAMNETELKAVAAYRFGKDIKTEYRLSLQDMANRVHQFSSGLNEEYTDE
jgi:hypothetical protein